MSRPSMLATAARRCGALAAIALGLGVLAAGGARPALAQQRVGVNSAVNPDASGTPPGASMRRLVIGQDIVFNEKIATTASGQTQILFVDGSALSVGPGSDMVIDQFVYNPKTSAGRLAMSATKGLFRFVGGQLSKGDNSVTMTTSVATIGIRGGVFMMDLTAEGRLEIVFLYGRALTITTSNGITRTLLRPGYAIIIPGKGAPPSEPFVLPVSIMTAFLDAFDGRPGETGGAPQLPTDLTVVQSGIEQTISGNYAASVTAAAGQGLPSGSPPVYNIAGLPNEYRVGTVQATSSPIILGSALHPTPPGTPVKPPPPVPPPPPPPVVVTYAGGFNSTNGAGTAQGFTDPQIPYTVGTLVNGVFSTALGGGTLTIPLTAGQASFGPAGTQSPLGPVSGTSYLSADGTFFYADLTPVDDPGQSEFVYGGLPLSPDAYPAMNATQYSAFTLAQDAALQSPIPFITQATGGSLANPTVSPLIFATPPNSAFAPGYSSGSAGLTKALQASLAIDGAGAAQSSVLVVAVGDVFSTSLNGTSAPQPVLEGTIHGTYSPNASLTPTRINSQFVTSTDGNGVSFYGGSTISGFVLNQNACCTGSGGQVNQLATTTQTGNLATTSYGFTQPAVASAVPAGVLNATQTTQTTTGYFGGIMIEEPPTAGGGRITPYPITGTTSVSTDASDLQIAATFTGNNPFNEDQSTAGPQVLTLQFGTLAPGATAGRQAFINDSLYAALESPDTASTVAGVPVVDSTGNPLGASDIYLVTASAAPPTGLLPAGAAFCQCQYLQWGYWGGELDTPASGTTAARRDVGNINFFLAGQPTVVMPTSGIGTFTGAAIGSVYTAGANYVAAGGFTNTYNFATNSGVAAISNFDGRNFATTVTGTAGGPTYSGTFTGALQGPINGSFYGPMAAETGGNFAVESTTGAQYFASGIFAAKR